MDLFQNLHLLHKQEMTYPLPGLQLLCQEAMLEEEESLKTFQKMYHSQATKLEFQEEEREDPLELVEQQLAGKAEDLEKQLVGEEEVLELVEHLAGEVGELGERLAEEV